MLIIKLIMSDQTKIGWLWKGNGARGVNCGLFLRMSYMINSKRLVHIFFLQLILPIMSDRLLFLRSSRWNCSIQTKKIREAKHFCNLFYSPLWLLITFYHKFSAWCFLSQALHLKLFLILIWLGGCFQENQVRSMQKWFSWPTRRFLKGETNICQTLYSEFRKGICSPMKLGFYPTFRGCSLEST